jgi:hypothetical protein
MSAGSRVITGAWTALAEQVRTFSLLIGEEAKEEKVTKNEQKA